MRPETPVEVAKRSSRGLRGGLAQTIAAGAEHFEGDDKTLLKFHGIYEQYDRDARARVEARRHTFMVRIALPGGVLSASQYRALDDLADRFGGGTMRLTSRQGVQFHGLLLGDLKPALQSLNSALLTTLAACGDVRRNVAACPAPLDDPAHREVQAMARAIAEELQPRTRAYHEIWLDGEPLVAPPSPVDEEPFYGSSYLPRKFKVGVAIDADNCVDLYTQDAGLLAITDGGRLAGYNLVAGGGLGITHGKGDTFARLASTVGFVESTQPGDTARGVAAIRAVAEVFRDHGDRGDRKRARLKYVLEAWGIERFREEVQRRLPFPLLAPRPSRPLHQNDHLGRHPQGDGRDFLGVFVENGRVIDRGASRLKAALREIAERFAPGIRLTAQQSVLLTDLSPTAADEIEALLDDHGVATTSRLSVVRRSSLACPALPTCSLALTDAERVLPGVLDELEGEFARLGIDDRPLTVRMTGCPNGCARPYNADLAFVGRKPGVYHVYVGGGLAGDRLVDLFAADVPIAEFVAVLRPLLERYRDERRSGESLSDTWQRLVAHPTPRHLLTGRETALGLRWELAETRR